MEPALRPRGACGILRAMKRFLPLPILLAFVLPAAAGTDCWTYAPPPAGKTRGTISWTDSSGFENVVQGISRDLLCCAMQTLRRCRIVAHVHDEIIIEANPTVSLDAVCEQMGRTPPWAEGLLLRADGYECAFYQKD